MTLDLSWVTDDNELEAIANGDMSKVSDATLVRLSNHEDTPAPVQPDTTKLKDYFQRNLDNHVNTPKVETPSSQSPREADTFMDALEAGWQMSVSGLIDRKRTPDVVMKEHAGTFMNIASQAATFVGDIPAMIAGESIGAGVGGVVGTAYMPILGIGTAVGAGVGGAAGAFGLPAAMRHIMMDHYQRGDIKTAGEFMERAASTFLDTAKNSVTGVLTVGLGNYAGLATEGAGKVVSSIASKVTEAATMTSLSAAFEGRLPEVKDFSEAAIFIGGLHGIHALPEKLMNIYAKTGVRPEEVVQHMEENPTLKQDLISAPPGELPEFYEPMHQQELGLQPKAQDEFNFDAAPPKERTVRDARIEVAKRLDPRAFEALDSVEKRLNDLAEKRTTLDDKRKEIEQGLKDIDYTADPEVWKSKEETLQEQLKENDKNLEIANNELTRALNGADKIKKRVAGAYHSALPLVDIPAKDLEVKLSPESILNKLADEHANKEFVTPETTMGLVDPNHIQSELDLGANGELPFSVKDVIKDHPMVVKAIVDAENAKAREGFSDGENAMLDMVGTSKEPEADPLFSKKSRERFRTNFIDGLYELEARSKDLAKGKKLEPIDSPAILAARASTYTGLVEHMYDFGVFDYNDGTKQTTRGFWEIVGENYEDAQKLKAYMIAERGLEIIKSGKNPGEKFDQAFAEKTVREGKKEYAKRAEELVNFQNEVLRYLKNSGFLSEEQYKNITDKNEKYLPWFRIDPKLTVTEGSTTKKSKTNPIKELKGSDKDIVDPFVSILKNVDMYVRLAEQQRAKKAFIDLNMSVPEEERFIKEVKSKETSQSADPIEQVANNMAESRVEKSGTVHTFTYVEDGKTRTFETTPEIYEAWNLLGSNKGAANLLVQTLRNVTKIKRAGISLAPEFQIKNPLRDWQVSGAFIEGGYFSPKEIKDAIFDIKNKTPTYRDYLKSGGAHNTFFEINQDFVDRQLNKLEEKTGVWDLGWSTIRNGVDWLAAKGELTEEMTRVAAFKRKAGANPDMAALIAGGHASKEATVDFSKVGAKMTAFRAITAFQGAQIQGVDRFVRALQIDTKGVVFRSSLISAATVLLWAATRDDERLKELPEYQRNQAFTIPINYWVDADAKELEQVPDHSKRMVNGKWQVNNGPILRIPMSQEGGLVFGAPIRKLLEKLDSNNPIRAGEFAKEILSQFTPSLVPDAALPAVEAFFNKSLFTGNKLVPAYLEKEMPEHIYTPYTSELAKGLSKLVGQVPFIDPVDQPFNPIVVDNWIKSWSGTIGQYALGMVDGAVHLGKAIADPAAKNLDPLGYLSALSLSDIPVVKAFVYRHPGMGMQPIQDFYELSDRAQKVANSVQTLIDQGDATGAQKLIDSQQSLFIMAKPLKDAQASISQMTKIIKKLDQSNDMSAIEKRHIIDGMYYQICGIAKTMVKQSDDFKNNVAKNQTETLP